MRRTHGRIVVVESLTELDLRLAAGARRLVGWRVVGLDLRERAEQLAACDTSRATFVGCRFAPGEAERHAATGALVLPSVAHTPVDPRRVELYTPDELYDATPYDGSLDGRAYGWSQSATGPDRLLAQALHDEAIDTALAAWVRDRRLVGVMGGHAVPRGSGQYDATARLAQQLARHRTVATGGGPGAMEAANLGARLANHDDEALAEAAAVLARVPSFHPSVDAWVAPAREVRERWPDPVASLGVPTWHYGHEPPNLFATAVAKYFRNAQREAVLLELCNAGIVFLPGAAGTVQEVFADACENYYAAPHAVAPMVLVGAAYWTETLPAWPLLQALARDRAMEEHVHLVDSVEEAVALLAADLP